MTVSERSQNSVFIGNISFDATEENLKELFCQVGPVVGIRIVFDRETGKTKGYGFCEYADKETALSAQRNLNGVEFCGRHLRVDAAAGEKNKEEMQQLRLAFSDKPEEELKNIEHDPQKVPHEIAKAVVQLSPEQMYELIREVKLCAKLNAVEAKNMLQQQPHLAFALLQVLLCTKKLNFNQAMSMLASQPTADKQKEPNYNAAAPHRAPLLNSSLQPLQSTPGIVAPPNIVAPRSGTVSVAVPTPSLSIPESVPPPPPPPPTQSAQLEADTEKSALIKQVMNLTQEQIDALPAEHRQTILNLRQQFQNKPRF